MSVQATTWAWEHSRAEGNARLVLLAIADAANKQGARSYQSAATIADMCRLSSRTVQRQLAALVESGEAQIEERKGAHGTNSYRLPGVLVGGPIEPQPIRHSSDVRQSDVYDSRGQSIRQPGHVDTTVEVASYDTAVSPDPKTPVNPRTPWVAADADDAQAPAAEPVLEGQIEAFDLPVQQMAAGVEAEPWATVAKRVYDGTDGALPFMGMRAIAKWAIEKKGVTPEATEAAIGSLWRAGRAVTKQTVAQHLDGHLQPRTAGMSQRRQEMSDYERRKGLTRPAGAPRGEIAR